MGEYEREWLGVFLTPEQQLEFIRKVNLARQDRHSVLPVKTPEEFLIPRGEPFACEVSLYSLFNRVYSNEAIAIRRQLRRIAQEMAAEIRQPKLTGDAK